MSNTRPHQPTRQGERAQLLEELVAIEGRVREIESELDGMSTRERSHLQAKQRDARDTLERGDTKTLIILEPASDNDGEAVSKINGIYTFVQPGSFDLLRGDVISGRIVDVGDNHAEAIALEHHQGGQ